MVSSKDSSQANAGMSMIRFKIFKMESFQLDMQTTRGQMRFKLSSLQAQWRRLAHPNQLDVYIKLYQSSRTWDPSWLDFGVV